MNNSLQRAECCWRCCISKQRTYCFCNTLILERAGFLFPGSWSAGQKTEYQKISVVGTNVIFKSEAATELLVCWKWFHHTSFFLWGHPRPEKSSKGLCKRKRRGRNEEREKGKPFTGHWIRAVTWPWLRLATNSINYKQLPFSSSCQK